MQGVNQKPSFVHLRCHSEYSILDGIVKISDYVDAAKQDVMPALALTDLSNIFGAVKFYKSARKQGIKPIIGCDVWLENESNRDQPSRVLLLVQSHAGYHLLCELLTKAYLNNQYRGRAELKKRWLAGATDGLILISGNSQSDIGQALNQNNITLAKTIAQDWSYLFPNRFYLELQRTEVRQAENTQQEQLVQHNLIVAHELNLPVVATQPIQFIQQDDFKAHEARTCIAEGYMLADSRRPKRFTEEQYFKTQAQMQALFSDIPEALINSVQIAKRCNLVFTLGENYLPNFTTPDQMDLDSYLIQQSTLGLQQRLDALYPDQNTREAKRAEYVNRLDFECSIINQMGFSSYFLIVADFINWAKNNNVPVGPGRGSGAGSLVAYSLGITNLDPLEYDLLFERFLNPERVSMPDFDIDFCQEGRDQVIDYVKKKYGIDSVSQIVTFGTMAAKAVIRDVGRVLDLPFNFVDSIAKLVPLELGITLEDALKKEPQLQERRENEEEVAQLLELALRLEGLVRNVGMHAGGVLIAPGKMSDFSPVYCQANGESLVSQYDKDDIESLGLVKFDFLGLRTLTILAMAIDNVNAQRLGDNQAPLTLESIPLDDKATFDLLRDANTTAVFQLESRGMKDMLKQAAPDCFEDIIALVALYRPGPMDLIPDFCRRKHGQQRVEYPHPSTESILKETYGIAVYQEQVMQIAQVVAGYSLGAADLLRRAMGKKKPEEMVKQRTIFNEGAQKNGLSPQQSNDLFDLLEKFSGYGFNKSHAAAYALLAYQTAYLKTHYPSAFLAATMSLDMNNTSSVHIFFNDCAPNGVEVLPPDINQSEYQFKSVNAQKILYGLGAIKGTGIAAIEQIIAAREQGGPFTDLFNFCSRLDLRKVNRRVIESLVRAGAFDQLEPNRAMLLAGVNLAVSAAEQNNMHVGQDNLFSADLSFQHKLPEIEGWAPKEQLVEEKSALGFYFSGHPYLSYKAELSHFLQGSLADLAPQEQAKLLAGVVTEVRMRMTQRGKMAIVTIDDAIARVEVIVGSELLSEYASLIKEDQLLIIEGRIRYDDFSGGNRVSAKRIFDLPAARTTYASMLKIFCNGQLDTSKLTSILSAYRHQSADVNQLCPITIEYQNEKGQVSLVLGNDWRVTLQNELINHLESWLSKENVKILYN